MGLLVGPGVRRGGGRRFCCTAPFCMYSPCILTLSPVPVDGLISTGSPRITLAHSERCIETRGLSLNSHFTSAFRPWCHFMPGGVVRAILACLAVLYHGQNTGSACSWATTLVEVHLTRVSCSVIRSVLPALAICDQSCQRLIASKLATRRAGIVAAQCLCDCSVRTPCGSETHTVTTASPLDHSIPRVCLSIAQP